MLKGIATVGAWTMASRVLGFVRDMLIAAILGAGPVADAFFVALKLPNLFRRLFGEGAFNAAFVPAFAGMLAESGPAVARRFAIETFAVMAFWLTLLTVAGEIAMPWIVAAIAPGFSADAGKFALSVELARITFPYLVLVCLAALVSGVLNGMERFAAAAASYVLFNAVSIACMLWLTPYVATAGHALAWGVTVSGAGQLGLLVWASARAGMKLSLPRPRLTPEIRALLRKMAPGLIGAGVTQLNLAVDVIVASLLPAGTVSILYYADRVQQLPLGVVGVAAGTAMLPTLSRQVRIGDRAGAMDTQNRAIEVSLLLTLPAAGALIAAGWPIVWTLFGRGAFDAESARATAWALAAYAVGLPAFVLAKVLTPPFFARGDTATPVRVGMACVGLNLALNLALMGPCGFLAPPLAASAAAIANVAWLWIVLVRRGDMEADARLASRLWRMAAAAGAMAGALGAAAAWGFDPLAAWVSRPGALAVLVALGGGVFLAAAQALGAADWRDVARAVRRR